MRFSIRSKLILVIGGPLVAVYLLMLGLNHRAAKETALRNMRDHLTELTSHHAVRFDGMFSTVAQVAQCVGGFLSAQPDTTEERIYSLLRYAVEHGPKVYGACVAFEPNAFRPDRPRFAPYVCKGEKGLRSLDTGRAYDYLRWDWYLIPRLLDRPSWTDPYYDEGAGNILMSTYSVPFGEGGKIRGVTTVDISLESLRDDVSATATGGGYCVIVSQSGTFISHPNKSYIMRETIFSLAEWYEMPDLAELGREMIAGKQGFRRVADVHTRQPKWIFFAPIPSCGWSFAAVMSEDEVLAPVYADLRRQMSLMFIGLVLIVGTILLTAIRITRPIEELAQAVRKVAAGDLDAHVTQTHARDEIGDFARAFNKMLADLKAHVEALTRETAAREAVESELRIARTIQASLLPRTFPPFPHRKEFSLHAVNAPAKQVAGDFFDFYFVTDNHLLITIADVSGKGVPAALFMAVTRTLLRNLIQSDMGPADALAKANNILAQDNDESMFVTLFLGIYDTQTGRLRYANAGHNPPHHLGPGGKMHPSIKATGPILGVIEGQEFSENEVRINAGDLLVMYTDGVTEAQTRDGELYSDERFRDLLAHHATEAPEQLCKTIVEAVNRYQGDNQYDDITLLILQRNL